MITKSERTEYLRRIMLKAARDYSAAYVALDATEQRPLAAFEAAETLLSEREAIFEAIALEWAFSDEPTHTRRLGKKYL